MPPTPRPAIASIGTPMGAIPELLRPGVQRLCSNESPLGPSLMAIAAATASLGRAHEYPEGEGGDLVAAIADHFAVRADRIRLGSGSDTLMLYATMAFAGPGDEVVFSARGYSRYARNALIAGATPVPVPDRDFGADADALLDAITPRTRMVMLANPDNPSGAMLPLADIETLHARLPGNVLLIVDGAYADYCAIPPTATAGWRCRIGPITFSSAAPFRNYSVWLAAAGLADRRSGGAGRGGQGRSDLPCDGGCARRRPRRAGRHGAPGGGRAHNDRWLPWLAETLGRSNQLRLYPSQSNFQLIEFPTREMVRACTAHLAANDILVRHFGPGAHERQMRISIGNAERWRVPPP